MKIFLNERIHNAFTDQFHRDYSLGVIKLHEDRILPLMDNREWLDWRIKDALFGSLLLFIELDCHITIDNDDLFINFNHHCAKYLTLTNDLYSFKTELKLKEFANNYLIRLLSIDNNFENALEKILDEISNTLEKIDLYRNQLISRGDFKIRKYLDQCTNFMSNFIIFCRLTKRYR